MFTRQKHFMRDRFDFTVPIRVFRRSRTKIKRDRLLRECVIFIKQGTNKRQRNLGTRVQLEMISYHGDRVRV